MKDKSAQKIARVICRVASIENKKILEIGCGDGRVTVFLSGKPKEFIAIEPDKNAIADARRIVPGVDFQVGSGEKMIFSNESFDLVIFTLSLHHQNSDLALREAARVLKDDGKILIVEPAVEGEVECVFSLVHNEDKEKLNAQKSIRKSNLEVVHSEVFTAEWLFDDKEDLCRSIFEYYHLPLDPKIREEIIGLVRDKPDKKPFGLEDVMEIHVLKKNGREFRAGSLFAEKPINRLKYNG